MLNFLLYYVMLQVATQQGIATWAPAGIYMQYLF
jgi:hypothetical protein